MEKRETGEWEQEKQVDGNKKSWKNSRYHRIKGLACKPIKAFAEKKKKTGSSCL